MTATRIIAAVVALLLGVQIVRNAAVLAWSESDPTLASKFWSAHPAVEAANSMTEIAEAARARRPVPPSAFSMMGDAATKSPLAPDPFLVRGVQAQLRGDGATAQRAFEAAQWRDPRSLAAAYFLADRYFRAADPERGLHQVAALARLAPNGQAVVGPYLAAYATNPANWPALRRLFRANPGLANNALAALATNVATVPALLALADPQAKAKDVSWLPALLSTLTGAGKFAQAREIWAKMAGVQLTPGQLLYDASFADHTSPPPFNWDLNSSTVGLTERQPGGRLHVVFYGQEDGFLASELILLSPGLYQLSLQVLGDPARSHSLNWSVWCDKAAEPIASVTLDAAAAHGWRFEVPSGCPAQWLKLSGVSGDIPQQSDVVIGALNLKRLPPGA